MSAAIWPAPAKINLFLHINRQRADGYHELQTVFRFLDLCDELSFRITDDTTIKHSHPPAGIEADKELCLRAARLLQQTCQINKGVEITLRKHIPEGGGLGGGSSDAATTLLVLNRLWGANLSPQQLTEPGLQLGADVPVFLFGKSAWAEGLGEKLTGIELDPAWYVIIAPAARVATAEIFAHPELTRDSPPITIRAFREGRVSNDLEPVVRKLYPPVDQALRWLSEHGQPRMSGSGACVFVAVASRAQGEQILSQCPSDYSGFVVRGLDQSPLMQRLAEEED